MTRRGQPISVGICVVLFSCVGAIAGCAGSASVQMIPLDARRISATAPLIVHVRSHRCYYWFNDKQELCVALRDVRPSIAGAMRSRELNLSLVLGAAPAATSRDYRVTRETARLKYRRGMSHTRSASLAGIVGVWSFGDGRTLKGRFRFTAKTQSFFALSGWSGNKRTLYVGEFVAVSNRAAGEAILAATESDGMERNGAPFAVPVQGPPRDTKTRDP